MSILSASIMVISTVFCILIRDSLEPVLLAMLLTYIIRLAEFIMYLMYLIGQTEKKFVSF